VDIIQGAALTAGSLTSNLDAGGDLSALEKVTAVWNNAANITGNGDLFTVRFAIKDGAEDGVEPLELTYAASGGVVAASGSDITDIALSVTQGQISIAAFKYGNIFSGPDGEDTAIDIKDAVKLAQHLAGWSSAALTPAEEKAADVYPDGLVDIKDAVRLAQYLAEWPGIVLGEK
jgi:hypothetical protein